MKTHTYIWAGIYAAIIGGLYILLSALWFLFTGLNGDTNPHVCDGTCKFLSSVFSPVQSVYNLLGNQFWLTTIVFIVFFGLIGLCLGFLIDKRIKNHIP